MTEITETEALRLICKTHHPVLTKHELSKSDKIALTNFLLKNNHRAAAEFVSLCSLDEFNRWVKKCKDRKKNNGM